MDYTETRDQFVAEPLLELIGFEFKDMKIGEIREGEESISIKDLPSTLLEKRSRSRLYQHVIEITYDYKAGSRYNKKIRKHLSHIMARMQRLVDNYRDFTVVQNWIDETGLWGNTTRNWSDPNFRYCWHGGGIESTNMDQDSDDLQSDHWQVVMIFECYREDIDV